MFSNQPTQSLVPDFEQRLLKIATASVYCSLLPDLRTRRVINVSYVDYPGVVSPSDLSLSSLQILLQVRMN